MGRSVEDVAKLFGPLPYFYLGIQLNANLQGALNVFDEKDPTAIPTRFREQATSLDDTKLHNLDETDLSDLRIGIPAVSAQKKQTRPLTLSRAGTLS